MTTQITQITSGYHGVRRYRVKSEHQAGTTHIDVSLPVSPEVTGRVLYLLPVDRHGGSAWGNAIEECRRLNLANRYSLICVQPTFSHLPWYADHATDHTRQDESYLLNTVVPFIDDEFGNKERLLVGFSKSGFGAWSLLLRHPEAFQRAAAFDAPLGMTTHSTYGASAAFGSQQNFDKYNVWNLLKTKADVLTLTTRLALLGHGDFRGHVQAMHYHLLKLGIPHHYVDGPDRAHRWDSGWLEEAVRLLTSA